MVSREAVEGFLIRMDLEYDEVDEGMFLAHGQNGGAGVVVHHSEPVLVLRLKMMNLPAGSGEALAGLYRSLLELNATDIVHGGLRHRGRRADPDRHARTGESGFHRAAGFDREPANRGVQSLGHDPRACGSGERRCTAGDGGLNHGDLPEAVDAHQVEPQRPDRESGKPGEDAQPDHPRHARPARQGEAGCRGCDRGRAQTRGPDGRGVQTGRGVGEAGDDGRTGRSRRPRHAGSGAASGARAARGNAGADLAFAEGGDREAQGVCSEP